MSDNKRVCFRCAGKKKMYKQGAGYTAVNCGGKIVDCPMCAGTGKIDSKEEAERKVNEHLAKVSSEVIEDKPKRKAGRPKKVKSEG